MAVTDGLCRSFLDLWEHFDPAGASLAGPGSHDSRFGTFDAEAVRAHVAALRSMAGAVEDLDVDDTADEIDRTALLDHIRVQLFRLEREHPWQLNPALWIEHAATGLDALLLRGPDAPGLDEAIAGRLRDLPRLLHDARDTIRHPPLFLVDSAQAGLPGLAALVAAAGDALGAALEERAGLVTEAEGAIERFHLALRAELAPETAPAAAALGEDAVDRRLHFEQASRHNGAELWRAALREATEREQEVVALAAAIDATRPWRDVYERIAGGPPRDGVRRLADALAAAARFADTADLLTLAVAPPAVTPMPDWARRSEPASLYLAAAPGQAARIRLAAGDQAIPWTAARLGVPGAHAAETIRAVLPSLIRRRIGASSLELGWWLYAAELMREAGWEHDPESRLQERVLALVDTHLAVLDLGIHARQMSPGEAIDHLTARLPLDRAAAEAHIRRIVSHPTTACAALLGRRELLHLRDDVRAARGAGFSHRAFHEEILGYGALPVPLIRWGMGLDA